MLKRLRSSSPKGICIDILFRDEYIASYGNYKKEEFIMNALETIIKHPIATAVIAGSLFGGITQIIGTIKGVKVEPMVNVQIGTKPKEQ